MWHIGIRYEFSFHFYKTRYISLITNFAAGVSLIQHKSMYCVDNGGPSGQNTKVDDKSFKTTGDT